MARPAHTLWELSGAQSPTAAAQYVAACAPLFDVRLHDRPVDFHNRLEAYEFAAMVCGRCQGSGQVFRREARHIRQGQVDHIQIVLNRSGVWAADYDGRRCDSSQGTLKLIEMDRPFVMETSAFETLNLMMPRSLFGQALAEDVHGLVLDEAGASARLLSGHIEALWAALPGLDLDQAAHVAAATAALAAAALAEAAPAARAGAGAGGWSAALLAAIRDEIDRNLAEPGLDPAWIQRRLGVSRSTLYRLCEGRGGVMAVIRHRRLDRAYALIARGADRLALDQVAHAHGFTSINHFHRLFRRRFGMTPGAVRRAGGPARPSAVDEPPSSAVFDWIDRL